MKEEVKIFRLKVSMIPLYACKIASIFFMLLLLLKEFPIRVEKL